MSTTLLPESSTSSIDQLLDVALDHHRSGRLREAERIYREILEASPHQRDALHLRGVVAHQLGNNDEAIRSIRQALRVDPTQATFHNSLGAVHQSLGELAEAVACYRQSIMLDMDYATAHSNLGLALRDLGMHAEAVAALRRALSLDPKLAEAHNGLGMALRSLGRVAEATAAYRQALEIRNDFWEAYSNLGNVLKDQGNTAEAVASHERSLALEPRACGTHSNLLCALQYQPGITQQALAAAHAGFERAFGVPTQSAWRPHDNDRDPERRLRLGFLSPDLHRHPIGYFATAVLEHLARGRAEIFCYASSRSPDDLTNRLRAASTGWRDVCKWTAERTVEQIRDDGIDILFDLAGHTGNNRLMVFAHRPAPIQVTWAGYVGTTGLRAIDYILADEYEIPRGAEAFYSERVLRMPHGYVCYEPPDYAPTVSPLPALANGHVTFGSLNYPAKLNAGVVEVWSRILSGVPESRLVLKYKGLDDVAQTARLGELFSRNGIDPARVEFSGGAPHREMLESYGGIDIALDPFPYSGGLTTIEALWMGVPVVTWPGETFAGRHSLTHLSNAGLTSTIADDPEQYVEIAVALTRDLAALAELRAGLRERVAASPLCDGERFAEDLLQLLRGAWREWVDGEQDTVTPVDRATCPAPSNPDVDAKKGHGE